MRFERTKNKDGRYVCYKASKSCSSHYHSQSQATIQNFLKEFTTVLSGKKFTCRDFPCRDLFFLHYFEKYLNEFSKTNMKFLELVEFYNNNIKFIRFGLVGSVRDDHQKS